MTGVVTEADVRAAQATLDALDEAEAADEDLLSGTRRLQARGILAAQFADMRTTGYLEGLEAGRRQVANWVRDALTGEGL